jgi:hypothetical protein
MVQREMQTSPSLAQQQNWTRLLKHPLIVLLLGSFISAVLIPALTSRINERKLLGETRLSEARTILRDGTLADKQLATMFTTLESFIKDAPSDRESLAMAQSELKKSMDEQYRTFDEHAWWWTRDLPAQATILKMSIDARKRLDDYTTQYQRNLRASTHALDPPWGCALGRNLKVPDSSTALLFEEAKRKLDTLSAERATLVSNLAKLFSSEEE